MCPSYVLKVFWRVRLLLFQDPSITPQNLVFWSLYFSTPFGVVFPRQQHEICWNCKYDKSQVSILEIKVIKQNVVVSMWYQLRKRMSIISICIMVQNKNKIKKQNQSIGRKTQFIHFYSLNMTLNILIKLTFILRNFNNNILQEKNTREKNQFAIYVYGYKHFHGYFERLGQNCRYLAYTLPLSQYRARGPCC